MWLELRELDFSTGLGNQPPAQSEKIAKTNIQGRKGAGVCREKPLKQVRLPRQRKDGAPTQPVTILQGQKQPRHDFGRAIDAAVHCLVTSKIITGDGLGQGLCLPENQSQALARQRIDRAGRVSHQGDAASTNPAQDTQSRDCAQVPGDWPRAFQSPGDLWELQESFSQANSR